MTKFTVIQLAPMNPTPLIVDGDQVDFGKWYTFLFCLSFTGRGYTRRVAAARVALTRLFCFCDLNTKLKLYLIKALVIPILTYPLVPTHALSKRSIS